MTAYRYPDGNVFYRKLGRSYPRIVRGEGCWLYDEQGKDYLDAVGGAYVANLGHSNPEVADALARQAREFGYLSAAVVPTYLGFDARLVETARDRRNSVLGNLVRWRHMESAGNISHEFDLGECYPDGTLVSNEEAGRGSFRLRLRNRTVGAHPRGDG